jgi:hypothetical protein
MEYSIQFVTNKFDSKLLNDILSCLVSKGVKYNAIKNGWNSARYAIHAKYPEQDVEVIEKEGKELTEKLSEIVKVYSKYDVTRTHLSIDLDYVSDVDFKFNLAIVPKENYGEPVNRNLSMPGQGSSGYYYEYESNPRVEDRIWYIRLDTNTNLIPDEKGFLTFVNLCKVLFERFNFPYGSYRDEDNDNIPDNKDDLLPWLDIVNFFSKPLVDKIGRKRLLTAPAKQVVLCSNGGVMLLVCSMYEGIYGCPDEIERVYNHLYK